MMQSEAHLVALPEELLRNLDELPNLVGHCKWERVGEGVSEGVKGVSEWAGSTWRSRRGKKPRDRQEFLPPSRSVLRPPVKNHAELRWVQCTCFS